MGKLPISRSRQWHPRAGGARHPWWQRTPQLFARQRMDPEWYLPARQGTGADTTPFPCHFQAENRPWKISTTQGLYRRMAGRYTSKIQSEQSLHLHWFTTWESGTPNALDWHQWDSFRFVAGSIFFCLQPENRIRRKTITNIWTPPIQSPSSIKSNRGI